MERTLALIIAAVIVSLLIPRGVLSQTASPGNISMVRGKLAEAGAPERGADPAAKADAAVPTLQEILERANKAMGGSEAWKSANTIMMKGVLQTEDSSAFVALEIYKKAPDKSLMKMKLPQDLEMREVCDGKRPGLRMRTEAITNSKARSWRTVCGGRNFQNSLA